jgi:hypothetical protein
MHLFKAVEQALVPQGDHRWVLSSSDRFANVDRQRLRNGYRALT